MKSANLTKKAFIFNSLGKKELQNVCGGAVYFEWCSATKTMRIRITAD